MVYLYSTIKMMHVPVNISEHYDDEIVLCKDVRTNFANYGIKGF